MSDKELTRETRLKVAEEKQREGAKAMAEYEAARVALNERTVKLRALRLEREAADAVAEAKAVKAKAAAAKKAATAKAAKAAAKPVRKKVAATA
ncbi:hypothetical protein [Terrihabitans sp. B22-R8]|uniref:hypothetical protein n=1 Tax=Terrihabitans sp. B22-R8 TaxID=3425128 RepID=UPI00403C304A